MKSLFKPLWIISCLIILALFVFTSCRVSDRPNDNDLGYGNNNGYNDRPNSTDDNKDEDDNQKVEPKVYTVNFFDNDGNLLKTESVIEGKAAKAPKDMVKDGFCFVGWDKEFDEIHSDLDVIAVYDTVENVYGSYDDVFQVEVKELDEKQVTITFSFKKDKAISAPIIGFQMRLRYDDGFIAKDVENGKGVSSSIHDNQGYISVVYINLNADAINEDFDFITATFTLSENITDGDRIFIETQYILDSLGNDISSAITISSEFVYKEYD